MARYLMIEGGVAVNALKIEDPSKFPGWTLVQSDSADIGDLWNGTTFSKDPAYEAEKLEQQRKNELRINADVYINAEAIVAELQDMKWSAYGPWWTGKTAAFKDGVLKYMLWVIVKKVLQ